MAGINMTIQNRKFSTPRLWDLKTNGEVGTWKPYFLISKVVADPLADSHVIRAVRHQGMEGDRPGTHCRRRRQRKDLTRLTSST